MAVVVVICGDASHNGNVVRRRWSVSRQSSSPTRDATPASGVAELVSSTMTTMMIIIIMMVAAR